MGRRARRKFAREHKTEVVRLVHASGKSIGQVARETARCRAEEPAHPHRRRAILGDGRPAWHHAEP